MAVFGATALDDAGRPDGEEVLELRFMSAEECRSVALARWVPIVLAAIFNAGTSC